MKERTDQERDRRTQHADLGVLAEALVEDGKGWFEAQKIHTRLVVSERLGRTSGMLVATVVLLLFVASTMLICSVSLGIWLGERMGNMPKGFLFVGGGYLLLTLLFYAFGRKAIRNYITLHVINAANAKD